ncbi:MAG: glutathione S-transferase N-terminal domain-containing protein [Polyangiales bacterium]
MRVELVTIPFSHYCEKARWALDRARVDYVERPYLPLLHTPAAMRAGSGRTVPVLVAEGRAVQDSTEILRWADARLDGAARLFPDGDAREVERLEARFDEALGPAARRWAYRYMLEDPPRLFGMIRGRVPRWQTAVFRAGFPAIRALMKKGMRITPEGAARSLERMREVFAEVAALLADGRPYLTGERFTAADLTFAALATPAIFPPELERFLAPLRDTPPAFIDVVEALRDTPAGRFALRMYREERGSSLG